MKVIAIYLRRALSIVISWSAIRELSSSAMRFSNSVIHYAKVFNREFYFKRDDLLRATIDKPKELHPHQIFLNGNKARKFAYLLDKQQKQEQKAYPQYIASCGGLQSNSMLALAKIAKLKSYKFHYFIHKRNSKTYGRLLNKPIGNFKCALDLGMKISILDDEEYKCILNEPTFSNLNFSPKFHGSNECTVNCILIKSMYHDDDDMKSERVADKVSIHWIPQGGVGSDAEFGCQTLADELMEFIRQNSNNDGKNWKIIISSGTGATAFFVNRCLQSNFGQDPTNNVKVVAVPCATSPDKLKMQMQQLDSNCGNKGKFPDILQVEDEHSFAFPREKLWNIWISLKSQSSIDFDLIYAPRTFELLMKHCAISNKNNDCSYNEKSSGGDVFNLKNLFPSSNIIYYHCGGQEGNLSQISRYQSRK